MTLVLRNMPVYRFRYVDTNGTERFAVLYKGQSTAHLNISDETLALLRRLIVGIGGEPHPVFTEVEAPVAVRPAPAPVVEAPAATQEVSVEVPAEPVAAAPAPKPAAKKAKPKAKAKKPTVNS